MSIDYDREIGFWIENIAYVWFGNTNINKCMRLYLLDTVDAASNINNLYYNVNDKSISWSNRSSTDTILSLFSRCNEEFSNIFRNFFMIYDGYNILNIIDAFSKKYNTEFWELRFYDSETKTLSNIFNKKDILLNSNTINVFDTKIDGISTFSLKESSEQLNRKGPKFYENKEHFQINKIFSVYSYEYQGKRGEMEDTTVMCKIKEDVYLFAVLDGHGDMGKISKHFSIDIANKLYNEIVLQDEEINANLIKKIFLNSDENFYVINNLYGGTCFSGVLITKYAIYIINLGDSRTIITNDKAEILFQTKDHKPNSKEERSRIIKEDFGVTSKYIFSNKGRIAVSRALGDADYKHNALVEKSSTFSIENPSRGWKGKDAAISPVPDVTSIPKIKFKDEETIQIIIHCDGIYEPKSFTEGNIVSTFYNSLSEGGNPCKAICNKAYELGSYDNLSALSIRMF